MRRETAFKKDGKQRQPKTVYLVKNLPPEQATSARLLALDRGRWGAVEHGIHDVPFVTLKEDDCRGRKGALPRGMAAFANLAISILRLLAVQNIRRSMDQVVPPRQSPGRIAPARRDPDFPPTGLFRTPLLKTA